MPKTRQVNDDLTVLFRNLEKRLSALEARVPSKRSKELGYPLLERVSLTSNQPISQNAFEDISWDQSDGPHTGAFWNGFSSLLISQYEGLYVASVTLEWEPLNGTITNAEDFWTVEIEKNDDEVLARSLPGAVGGNSIFGVASHASCPLYLDEGDYIKFRALQSTSTQRDIVTGVTSGALMYVGPFVSVSDIDRFETNAS